MTTLPILSIKPIFLGHSRPYGAGKGYRESDIIKAVHSLGSKRLRDIKRLCCSRSNTASSCMELTFDVSKILKADIGCNVEKMQLGLKPAVRCTICQCRFCGNGFFTERLWQPYRHATGHPLGKRSSFCAIQFDTPRRSVWPNVDAGHTWVRFRPTSCQAFA